jgi:5'(3')-deoxyribonucleotidase
MRIGVDLDDVLGDLIGALIALYAREDGVNLPRDAVTDWNVFPPHIHGKMIESGYASVRPIPGAREFLDALQRAGHEIWIITYRSPKVETSTRDWLDRHFPNLVQGLACTGGGKVEACRRLQVGLLVDDSRTQAPRVREALGIPGILITTPMNRDFPVGNGIYRADTLDEARSLALRLAGGTARREDAPVE